MNGFNRIKDLFPSKLRRNIKDYFGVPSLHASLQNIKRLGVKPNFVLDIGAYEGEWAIDFNEVFPDSKILMLEAQEEKTSTLESVKKNYPNIDYHISLIGAEDGKQFSFLKNETVSQVVEMEREGSNIIYGESLDAIITRGNFPFPDFIKIDVQGFEMEVMKGGLNCLQHAEFCL